MPWLLIWTGWAMTRSPGRVPGTNGAFHTDKIMPVFGLANTVAAAADMANFAFDRGRIAGHLGIIALAPWSFTH